MNRIILIGNGFDLAHGLATGYKDFILWYIKRCFENAHTNRHYEDRLIQITVTNYAYNLTFGESESREHWIDDYISKVEHPKRRMPVISYGWPDENRDIDRSPFKVIFKSPLLEPLLNSCNTKNWVDIESEYYELLMDVLEEKDIEERQTSLKGLNESLAIIISQLEEYLSTLPDAPYLKGYEEIFLSEINGQDLYPKRSNRVLNPKETFVLNFNYTNTPEQYINIIEKITEGSSPIMNYIHGKLRDKENELIFGFGDEVDTSYKKMEDDIKVRGYFDYIKSFWYLRTDNYRSLVNYLDSDEYQVYVLGHSCGLSDRTMLQMIFEHPQCRSIKIYYHERNGKDNFVSLTHEIARHFTDKGLMRKKILSKMRSDRMPQHND